MNQHTPEHWAYSTSKEGWSYSIHIHQADNASYTPDWSDVGYIMQTCKGERQQIQEANARRICACVNACAGIPTDVLEAIPSGADALLPMYTRLQRQRDELLEHMDTVARCSNDTALVAMANRAIAKIKEDNK